jgi:hypothetical protein
MTSQPIDDLYDDSYVAAPAFVPSVPIALRLPPVRPRPARASRSGRPFTTLAEYVELTHRLRAAAAHASGGA